MPIKHEQTDSDISDKSVLCKTELKDEKDCDSGRATLASTSLAPEEAHDSSDSGCNVVHKTGNCVIEVGGKSVQLRGRHQTPRNKKDRVSQLIIHSQMVPGTVDADRNSQLRE